MEYFALQFAIILTVLVGPLMFATYILAEAQMQREWQELHKLNGWELPAEGE